ncbi:MAG: hypothetical protein RSC44_03505 [Clostridia bacterium]
MNKFEKKQKTIAMMNENELWQMFAKTGDIELYNMYRAMKEYEEKGNSQKE